MEETLAILESELAPLGFHVLHAEGSVGQGFTIVLVSACNGLWFDFDPRDQWFGPQLVTPEAAALALDQPALAFSILEKSRGDLFRLLSERNGPAGELGPTSYSEVPEEARRWVNALREFAPEVLR